MGNGHAYCITGWSYNINLGLDKDCINSKQLINHGPMVADSGRDLVLGSVCMRHLWDSFMLVGERTDVHGTLWLHAGPFRPFSYDARLAQSG